MTTPGIGHNRPPTEAEETFAALSAKLSDFSDAASEWQRKGVRSKADAEDLADFISGAKKLRAAAYTAKRAEKEPHDKANKEIELRFARIDMAIAASLAPVQKIIDAWVASEKAAARARQAELALEAKDALEATRAAQEAARRRYDAIGQVEAAEAEKAASEALRAAETEVRVKVRSASGGGRALSTRVHRSVKVRNARLAFMEAQSDAGVIEAIEKALSARVRSKDWDGTTPAGCDLIEEERVS